MVQLHHMGGKVLRVNAMNAYGGSVVMSDGPGGRGAAVYEFEGDGLGVQDGLQLMLAQDGEVQEAVRRARVDEGLNGNRRLAWDEQMDQEGQMAGESGGEGGGGNRTAQPGSYWLGGSFFGTTEVWVLTWGLGRTAQGPGNGPWKEGNGKPGGMK